MVKWCNARSEKEGLTPCYCTGPAKTTVYKTGNLSLENNWVRWDADGYRLPTEAEWEYAARGGTAGRRFPWADADTISHTRANYDGSDWYSYDIGPSRGYHPDYETWTYGPYTSPVGSFAPNGYGLYDMAGNVWEWCWDWIDDDWYGKPRATEQDPKGPASVPYGGHVLRGGSWWDKAKGARCANRGGHYDPSNRSARIGFRCARSF